MVEETSILFADTVKYRNMLRENPGDTGIKLKSDIAFSKFEESRRNVNQYTFKYYFPQAFPF